MYPFVDHKLAFDAVKKRNEGKTTRTITATTPKETKGEKKRYKTNKNTTKANTTDGPEWWRAFFDNLLIISKWDNRTKCIRSYTNPPTNTWIINCSPEKKPMKEKNPIFCRMQAYWKYHPWTVHTHAQHITFEI